MSTHDHTAGRWPFQRDFTIARAGSALAAPLANQLRAWHETAAHLAALANHEILRGAPLQSIRDRVRTLADQIVSELEAWRSALTVEDRSGRVDDAEKSARSILATLDALRSRLG